MVATKKNVMAGKRAVETAKANAAELAKQRRTTTYNIPAYVAAKLQERAQLSGRAVAFEYETVIASALGTPCPAPCVSTRYDYKSLPPEKLVCLMLPGTPEMFAELDKRIDGKKLKTQSDVVRAILEEKFGEAK